MKKVLASVLLIASLGAALPAAAAPGNINDQERRIEQRINDGARRGALTRPEAMRLRAQLQDIKRLEARYRRGGLNGWERADLERRLDVLSARVFGERHDRDTRGGRH